MRKEPNAWQVAHLISTKKGGHRLLPPTFTGKRLNVPAGKARWLYNLGDPITRSRTTVTGKGVGSREMEWLRWIHQATVVEVADTAEGTIVLTFETALPSDDPRLSSIGVFKHRLSDLLSDGDEEYYNRSFVGFVPEGALPTENLQDMLDWNKLLYKYKEVQK
ncbi:MAG TPA: hypothetical protein VJ785_17405 [Anaerolineales bacterium]|nr:hypothetical protein [Anaerolineales bacterium]